MNVGCNGTGCFIFNRFLDCTRILYVYHMCIKKPQKRFKITNFIEFARQFFLMLCKFLYGFITISEIILVAIVLLKT